VLFALLKTWREMADSCVLTVHLVVRPIDFGLQLGTVHARIHPCLDSPIGAVGAFPVARSVHGWRSSWPKPHVVSVGRSLGRRSI